MFPLADRAGEESGVRPFPLLKLQREIDGEFKATDTDSKVISSALDQIHPKF